MLHKGTEWWNAPLNHCELKTPAYQSLSVCCTVASHQLSKQWCRFVDEVNRTEAKSDWTPMAPLRHFCAFFSIFLVIIVAASQRVAWNPMSFSLKCLLYSIDAFCTLWTPICQKWTRTKQLLSDQINIEFKIKKKIINHLNNYKHAHLPGNVAKKMCDIWHFYCIPPDSTIFTL